MHRTSHAWGHHMHRTLHAQGITCTRTSHARGHHIHEGLQQYQHLLHITEYSMHTYVPPSIPSISIFRVTSFISTGKGFTKEKRSFVFSPMDILSVKRLNISLLLLQLTTMGLQWESVCHTFPRYGYARTLGRERDGPAEEVSCSNHS